MDIAPPKNGDGLRLDADEALSDSDQTLSDADQTASDSDQTLAESDQRGALREQRASDSDQRAGDVAYAGLDNPTPDETSQHQRSRHERSQASRERLPIALSVRPPRWSATRLPSSATRFLKSGTRPAACATRATTSRLLRFGAHSRRSPTSRTETAHPEWLGNAHTAIAEGSIRAFGLPKRSVLHAQVHYVLLVHRRIHEGDD